MFFDSNENLTEHSTEFLNTNGLNMNDKGGNLNYTQKLYSDKNNPKIFPPFEANSLMNGDLKKLDQAQIENISPIFPMMSYIYKYLNSKEFVENAKKGYYGVNVQNFYVIRDYLSKYYQQNGKYKRNTGLRMHFTFN